jgi:hypothetical protein
MSEHKCMDCGAVLKYGEGWGGGGVCPRCRATRAHRKAKENAKASGRVLGSRHYREGV